MRLILLRHAKSAWNTEAPTDHERPLNKRGRRDAPLVGATLFARGWTPDHVLSSDAARTQETWELMRQAFPSPIEVTWSRALYHSSAGALKHLQARTEPTVMLIGHNPAWEGILETLCGQSHRLTTCNAALLSVDVSGWPAALSRLGEWDLVEVLRPREL